VKARSLNLLDLAIHKIDLLWGKYYYAQFEKSHIIDLITFRYSAFNNQIVEILAVQSHNQALMQIFTKEYSTKHKTKYFLRELNEITEVNDIAFMNSCGFRRINRRYFFEFDTSQSAEKPDFKKQFAYLCRAYDKDDLESLIEIDEHCISLEHREFLVRNELFFESNFDKIYVICSSSDTNQIAAFIYKEVLEVSVVNIIAPIRFSDELENLLLAFAEYFIDFEKSDTKFIFAIDSNHKKLVDILKIKYPLLKTTQLLALEGNTRERSQNPAFNLNLAVNPSPTS